MNLIDPTLHKDWVTPHSKIWYEQIGKLYGEYTYPWNSTVKEPNGEFIFNNEVFEMINNKTVLDVGCGHGEFTIKCSEIAKEIVGFDLTNDFIKSGNASKKSNMSFIVGSTKNRLPFESEQFDCAYNRKGPTSAYQELKRVVKKGGEILGLHPGDELGTELSKLFPNLFESINSEKPILKTIKQRVEISKFESVEIQVINSFEFLHTPLDVLKLRCFGQKESLLNEIIEENLIEVKRIFEQNATNEGLPITFSCYIVRAQV
ncbi:class I SAM-dependent methyltransferase [Bacillus sp. AFS029533]|uniref:class I SAM-dependent methyltransferase n=1 Tax=Bacillus sp. AFS029533 TaxID=2033494 RepID=UPI000BFBCECE|nr:class I SAM-dependent methyltransferase [Bacillus sp. AFS029533]PGZ85025.1 SAM-dependent methyltransferase [Bacillus sp. AFS029533]